MKQISGKNLVLIGFMGTGKTEVARLLADLLNRRLVDMDKLIEQREGRSVTEIFQARGEKYFRQLEKQLVLELVTRRRLVIATGGGVVLDQDNAAALRQTGLVVWLDADLATLQERLKDDETRPLLKKETDLAALYQARLPFYQAAAHAKVDTVGKLLRTVATEILEISAQNA